MMPEGNSLRITCGNHTFIISEDIEVRLGRLNLKGGKVLLQVPEGFKTCSLDIIQALSTAYPNVRFVVDANPNYGSCVMDLNLVSEFDLVIHFGHQEYPLWKPPENVVFAEVTYNPVLGKYTLAEAVGVLRGLGVRSVLIYTTQQHLRSVDVLADAVEDAGIDVVNRERLAFGCIYPQFRHDIDAIVVLAGGLFHSLGAGLKCMALKHIIQVDPYRSAVRVLDEVVRRWFKRRLWRVSEARYHGLGKHWLIIAGMCGQYREEVLGEITEALESRGQAYMICRSLFLTRDLLSALDSPSVGAAIITSCPRIAIDDLGDYHKPILTPGEALYALGYHEVYVFPW